MDSPLAQTRAGEQAATAGSPGGRDVEGELDRIGPEEQAALRRIATLVAKATPPEEVFTAVAEEVGRLLGSNFGILRRYERDRRVRDIAMWTNSDQPHPPLVRYPVALGGHNASTLVYDTGKAARIDSYDDDPGAAGAPALEAGVRSAIGVPVHVDGRLWGLVIASCTEGQELPANITARLERFTELIATAIANADARDELRRVAQAQSALRRVATLVAQSGSSSEVFTAVAEEARDLLHGHLAAIARSDADGGWTLVASAGDVEALDEPGERRMFWLLDRKRETALAGSDRAFEAARTSLEKDEGARLFFASPIMVNARFWGAIAVITGAETPGVVVEEQLREFTELVATAVANAEGRGELIASRARIVAASDDARRRIERDLHDGVQQRLIYLILLLRSAEKGLPEDQLDARESVATAADALGEVLTELQEISRGIHPAILSRGGLGPALASLGRRASVDVEVVVQGDYESLPDHVEAAAYYVVAEALANVVKHARATSADVCVTVADGSLRLRVTDNGVGGADPGRGSGLIGLADRVEALGGSFEIHTAPGAGTSLCAELPVGGTGEPETNREL